MEITVSPQSPLKEGTTTIFKCASNEGNPLPVIGWNLEHGINKVHSEKFNAQHSEKFNAQLSTESTLSIAVNRTMNQNKIACFIVADDTKGQKRLDKSVVLDVTCEYTAYHVYTTYV